MSDKCSEHTKLMVDITEIKTDVKYLIKMQDESVNHMNEHLRDADKRQRDIDKNNNFRAGATKIMWIIFTAMVGFAFAIIMLSIRIMYFNAI